jgi:hypothetical protein
MALTNKGTIVNIAPAQLPPDYVKPDFALNAYEYVRSIILSIPKATVENATKETTMANIVNEINTQVSALITADYDTVGLAVTAYSELNDLKSSFIVTEEFFSDVAINYYCKIEIFVLTEPLA